MPPILVVLLPILIACAVIWLPLYFLWRFTSGAVLRTWFRARHAAYGRTVMFVTSNSPNWQAYVEANILPRLGSRAVVLNWSERRHWRRGLRWEAWFFRRFAGDREFNPAALLYRPDGEIEVIRFHQPFLDLKHGHAESLRAAEAALFERVAV